MKAYKKVLEGTAGVGCCATIFVLAFVFTIGAICWPYTINSWLEFAGKEAAVVWWQGGLLGMIPFVGQFSVIAAVATWLIMMFV